MPTYIVLGNYTQQGIENIEDGPDRVDAAHELTESLGGEMEYYLTMGAYDLVAVLDLPDDDAAAKAVLGVGRSGNVRSETLKAWPEADYRDLIADLP